MYNVHKYLRQLYGPKVSEWPWIMFASNFMGGKYRYVGTVLLSWQDMNDTMYLQFVGPRLEEREVR